MTLAVMEITIIKDCNPLTLFMKNVMEDIQLKFVFQNYGTIGALMPGTKKRPYTLKQTCS